MGRHVCASPICRLMHRSPQQVPISAVRLAAASVARLAPRARTAHKGRLGHVLLVGGDRGYGGAVLLAAQMALRAGAGLVSLATREEHVAGALARLPEVMTRGVRSANQLGDLLAAASVLVLGPGSGSAGLGAQPLFGRVAAERALGCWMPTHSICWRCRRRRCL